MLPTVGQQFIRNYREHKDKRKMFQTNPIALPPAIPKPVPIKPDSLQVVEQPKNHLISEKIFKNPEYKKNVFGSLVLHSH